MTIKGTIVRIDEPQDSHHKFSLYLVVMTNSGNVGVQVRKLQADRYASDLAEGRNITAKVGYNHKTVMSDVSGKRYHHNNIILQELV